MKPAVIHRGEWRPVLPLLPQWCWTLEGPTNEGYHPDDCNGVHTDMYAELPHEVIEL